MAYRILHIPSGSYLKNHYGIDVIWETIEQAKYEIKQNCEEWPQYRSWNSHNKHIGRNLIESEFEIVEV